jgi:seryl-tRNA synthetase
VIDIQLLRNSIDSVAARLRSRGYELDVHAFGKLEKHRKDIQTTTEQLQAQRNSLSKQIGQAKAKKDEAQAAALLAQAAEFGDRLKQIEVQNDLVQAQLREFVSLIPNLPHESVPAGATPEQNVEVRRWGEARKFAFAPKDHVDLGAGLGGLDFDTAAKLAGARFAVMKGAVARLHRGLAQFMLDVHTGEHGYTEVYTPYMVSGACADGVTSLAKFSGDLFKLEGRDLYLIPTAEYPVTNFVRDEIVPLEQLPLKYVCHSPCFRSEAGAAGKDTRGMIRQHQFTKVELVSITTPEQSRDEHERMLACAEEVLRRLGLHYRVVTLCTGDMGFASQKTYDIEVWLPGQNAFREISSCSVCGDFQARRMNARVRAKDRSVRHVHTLNGSGVAVGRALIAVMETWQQEGGSITVPDVLQSYMGGKKVIEKA